MKNIPKHIGIILDGNRRWARKRGLTTFQGHKKGFDNLRTISTYAFEQGVDILTVYAFSTENWNRSKKEVGYLMKAGASAITKFPATKQFGTAKAHIVDSLIRDEKRDFISNIIALPNINWEKEINQLDIKEEYKQEMKDKIEPYLTKFRNPKDKDKRRLPNSTK